MRILRNIRTAFGGSIQFTRQPHQRLTPQDETVQLSVVRLADRDSCTFVPLLLGPSGLTLQFRLQQWGYTEDGHCNFLGMIYTSPSFDQPLLCVELDQRDLARSKVIPNPSLSDGGRQKSRLAAHQRFYPATDPDTGFVHADLDTVHLPVLSSDLVLDTWQGHMRFYQVVRGMRDDVDTMAVISGITKGEAISLLGGLVPATQNEPLADWHDSQMEGYMQGLGGRRFRER